MSENEEVKPWLVSSSEELAKDVQMVEEWKARWSSSYPGASASLSAKVAWAKNVETVKPSRRRTRLAHAEAPKHVGEILASIAYESCPEAVTVCAMCTRGMAKAAMLAADEAKLLSSPYRREWSSIDGFSTEGRGPLLKVLAPLVRIVKRPFRPKPTAAAFGEWLATDAPAGITLGEKASSPRKELVVFASIDCKKDDDVHEVFTTLMDSLGFDDASCSPMCEAGDNFAEAFFPLRDHVGKHLSILEADATTKVAFLVRPTMYIRKGSTRDETNLNTHEAFISELYKLAESHNGSRYFVLVPKDGFMPADLEDEEDDEDDENDDDDEDEDEVMEEKDDDEQDDDFDEEELLAAMEVDMDDDEEEISAENHDVLWVHPYYNSEYARLIAHVISGDGETTKIKATLQEGGAEAATLKLDLFLAEFNAMKSRYPKSETEIEAKKLCVLLAITNALVDDDSWFSDLPDADDLSDFISKKLATAWRDVLKHDDDILCLGLPSLGSEMPVAPDIPATPSTGEEANGSAQETTAPEPRAPLTLFLENSKKLFDHYGMKFNYAPRKRKTESDAATPAKSATSAKKKRKSAKSK